MSQNLKFQDGEGAPAEADQAGEVGGNGKKVMEFLTTLQQMLMALMSEIGAESEAAEEPSMQANAQGAGPVEVGVPLAAPKQPAQPSAAAIQNAAQSGNQLGMTARIEQLENIIRQQQLDNEVALIENDLKNRGFGEDYIKAFRETLKKPGGIVSARAFANGMIQNGPKDPPKKWTGETSYNDTDPEEVAAYAAKGPDMLDKARSFYASWKRTGSRVPLKDYLEINFDPEGAMSHARNGKR